MKSVKKFTSHTPSLGRILGKKPSDEEVNQEREGHEIQGTGSRKKEKRDAIIESPDLTSMHETRKAASQPWSKRNVSSYGITISYDMSDRIVREWGRIIHRWKVIQLYKQGNY